MDSQALTNANVEEESNRYAVLEAEHVAEVAGYIGRLGAHRTRPIVYVEVFGGNVQVVHTNVADADVIVVDFDNLNLLPSESTAMLSAAVDVVSKPSLSAVPMPNAPYDASAKGYYLIRINADERQLLADLSEAIDTSILSDDKFYRRASNLCSILSARRAR